MNALNIFKQRKWPIFIAVFLALAVTLLAVLPLAMQRIAVSWLENNGADKAAIGDIDLNIFTGRLGIHDLEVEKQGELPLRVWRLTADVDWWPLIRKRFFVKQVWLYEADLVIRSYEDGSLEIGGIQLPAEPSVEESSAEKEPEEDDSGPGLLDRWGVGIDVFAVRNTSIRFQSALIEESVEIKSFYALNVFSWQPEEPARINFDMLVNQQPITLLSDTRVFHETPDTSSTLQITHLDLSHYESVAKQTGVDELKGFLSLSLIFDAIYETDKRAHFTVDANVNLEDFRLRQGDLLFEQKNLTYETKASLHFPATAGQELGTTKGQLTIQDNMISTPELRAKFDELRWNGNAGIISAANPDAPPVIKVGGDAEVEGIEVDDEKAKLKLVSVKSITSKAIAVVLPDEIGVGEINLSEVKALQQTDPAAQPELPQINLDKGTLKNLQFNNAKQQATVASVALTDLSAQTADQKLQLAQVKALQVEQAAIKLQETASVKTVTLSEVHALKAIDEADATDHESVVKVSQTNLDNIQFQFAPQSLVLQTINVDGLNILVKREPDGSLYPMKLLPTSAAKKSSEPPPPSAEDKAEPKSQEPFTIKLEQLNIGKDSGVRIIDRSVTPTFTANVTPLNIVVKQIDNANPDSKTEIDMNTSLNSGNRISVNGWLTPFASKRDADIKVDINALDLVMFSPYAMSAAGYKVRSGRMNANISGKIDDDAVNAKAKMVAQRLKLDATSEEARGLSAQKLGIGMPIDAALALMKDKNGDIKIEVPVSGNLQDPNFAIGPAFRNAMMEAIKKASVTYAAYALQPYGSILIGAKMLDKAMALRLESVRFDPGETELNSHAKKYLEKIAGLMKERPGISITLCGSATEMDRKELRDRNVNKLEEKLIQLADQRGDTVKNFLISQHGIAADRFFNCQPEVTKDESAQPEVKLGL